MHRFEYCNASSCTLELLSLGQINMKMWYLFQCLNDGKPLRHGTQAEMIKLYVNDQLVAYSLLENYEARSDKTNFHEGCVYKDLGIVHFVTLPEHRKMGYASLLADRIYEQVIKPLLARHSDVYAFITATERAVPLMQRTAINPVNLVTQFYSQATFKDKVVAQINPS